MGSLVVMVDMGGQWQTDKRELRALSSRGWARGPANLGTNAKETYVRVRQDR